MHHVVGVDHVAPAFAHLVSLCCHPRMGMLLPDMLASLLLYLCRIKPAEQQHAQHLMNASIKRSIFTHSWH